MSDGASGSQRIFRLRSSDGVIFNVTEKAAIQSQTIKHAIEHADAEFTTIPLDNVTSEVLAKVIAYCSFHANVGGAGGRDLKIFDTDFVKVDMSMLKQLTMAADYLEIQGMLDLTCQAIANLVKGKTAQETREIFNIKNDFTPEEEEAIHKEYAWAFNNE